MPCTPAASLDEIAAWRRDVDSRVARYARALAAHEPDSQHLPTLVDLRASLAGGGSSPAAVAGLVPAAAMLATELECRRRQALAGRTVVSIRQIQSAVASRIGDRIQSNAQSLLELRGLRGSTAARIRQLAERVDADTAEHGRCAERLAALRAVQARLVHELLRPLSSDALRGQIAEMRSAVGMRTFVITGRPAFDALMGRLRDSLVAASTHADEVRQLLQASFAKVNAEFGMTLALPPPPPLAPFEAELELIARNYGNRFGVAQGWRLLTPDFGERFLRMLLSKLRVVFENAAGEFELWGKGATMQIESQLRDRQRACQRRRETLTRMLAVARRLDARIAELQAIDDGLSAQRQGLQMLADEVVELAAAAAAPTVPRAPGGSRRQDAA